MIKVQSINASGIALVCNDMEEKVLLCKVIRRIVAPLRDQELWVIIRFMNFTFLCVTVHLVKNYFMHNSHWQEFIIYMVRYRHYELLLLVMYGKFDTSFDMLSIH